MHLTPREQDKLLIFTAAEVARRRRGRGLKLNYPEALAYITGEVLEGIRDGRSVSDLMAFGVTILSRGDVMEGVPEMLDEVQVAGTFPDGERAGEGREMIPGEYILGEGDIEANAGRRTIELTVANTADRPIQVGSHFHFFEVNRALRFERSRAWGMRLNIPRAPRCASSRATRKW